MHRNWNQTNDSHTFLTSGHIGNAVQVFGVSFSSGAYTALALHCFVVLHISVTVKPVECCSPCFICKCTMHGLSPVREHHEIQLVQKRHSERFYYNAIHNSMAFICNNSDLNLLKKLHLGILGYTYAIRILRFLSGWKVKWHGLFLNVLTFSYFGMFLD